MHDDKFLGFRGQPVAKATGVDRFRQYNETFTLYDTKRQLYDEVSYQVGTRRVVNHPREDDEKTINHADRMRQHLISQFQWEVIA